MRNLLIAILIIVIVAIVIAVAIVVPAAVIHNKRKRFVIEHSEAIKQLNNINKEYSFRNVKSYILENTYDSETNFDNVSTKDYLTYKLVAMQDAVLKSIKDTEYNKIKFADYKDDIVKKCKYGNYNTDNLPAEKDKLLKIEKKCFEHNLKQPRISFSILVYLEYRKMNNEFQDSKEGRYDSTEIMKLISRINNKHGNHYNDKDIWDALCRVERAKVSNKMRFAIYDRDGHRCCKCGGYYDDLEIDHIIPISKGGKSTMDNLQTLCRRCNKEKGSNTERYVSRDRW